MKYETDKFEIIQEDIEDYIPFILDKKEEKIRNVREEQILQEIHREITRKKRIISRRAEKSRKDRVFDW